MKKYTKFTDSDHEVKTFRWPYWLLPLLFLSLVLVLGLFIFITIHSSDSFGCFFHCGQHTGQKIDNGGVSPPEFGHARDDNNNTDAETFPKHTRQDDHVKENEKKVSSQKKVDKIRIYGNLIFPKGHVPNIPSGSHLKVTLKDSGMQDASSIEIASTSVDLSLYKKGTPLSYEIKCARPSHTDLEVDAVLNMGWKANGDNWIKQGDYLVETSTPVYLVKGTTSYNVDVQLTKYN